MRGRARPSEPESGDSRPATTVTGDVDLLALDEPGLTVITPRALVDRLDF